MNGSSHVPAIETLQDQLEMYEAEKKALLSQALNAESTMASLASKYTQLLGHTNSKQKIHHLEKLKQDIFNLRKVRRFFLLLFYIIEPNGICFERN